MAVPKAGPRRNPAEAAASGQEVNRRRRQTPASPAQTGAQSGDKRLQRNSTRRSPSESAASGQELSRKRAQSRTSPGETATRGNVSSEKLRQTAEMARRLRNPIKEGTSRGAIDAAQDRASNRPSPRPGIGGMSDRAAAARKGWETRRGGGKK